MSSTTSPLPGDATLATRLSRGLGLLPQQSELVAALVARELKLRYRGTALGIVWSLANPLAFCLVLYLAVRHVMRVEIEDYPLFLLSALFPWQWLSSSVNSASTLFTSNVSVIKKLPLPRLSLCLSSVLAETIHFGVTIPVFGALLWIAHGTPPPLVWLAGVPLLVLIQTVTTVSLVLAIATANVFLRDLEQLVRVLLLLVFYVTPILYPLSMVPADLHWLVALNPVGPLVVAWRALLLDGTLSPWIAIAAVHAVWLSAVAFLVHHRAGWRVPEAV
jgi:lipopolysaccharide transport system permease protein